MTLFGVFRLLLKFILARFRVFPFQFFSKKSDNQCQNILAVRRYCILLYLGTHLDNYKPHVKYSIYDQQPFFLCINCINCINLIKDSKTLRSERKLCQFYLPKRPAPPPKIIKKSWFYRLLPNILALIVSIFWDLEYFPTGCCNSL